MKYRESREASGDILRLLLQKMTSQPAPFNPLSYAVWYEVLAGMNPPLAEALNKIAAAGQPLNGEVIAQLYLDYVAETGQDEQTEERQARLQQVLTKLAGVTAETDKHASQFGHSLQSYGDTLKRGAGTAGLGTLVGNLLGDTDKMRGSMQALQAQLEASKREVEKLNQELQSARGEALIDPLTGIFNRRGFESRAQSLLDEAASSKRGLCLLMIDIDHFKKINDTYGHPLGDKVIQAVATLLKSRVKGRDVVARFGGEEFAVLLPDTNPTGAFVVAEQIRQSIEKSKIRQLDKQEMIAGISVSIGLASFRNSLSTLIQEADQALYASKNAGRNRTTAA